MRLIKSIIILNCVLNGRKERRKRRRKERREGEEERQARKNDTSIDFCIKKVWFSLECRKVNGSVILVTTLRYAN